MLETFSAALDQLSSGFVACCADGRILHSNRAAREMMLLGWPILSENGYLRVWDRKRGGMLAESLLQAAAAIESREGYCVQVPLASRQSDHGAALATVKPLSVREHRSAKQYIIGLFVTRCDSSGTHDLSGIADCFALTRAERLALEHFARGASVPEAAAALAVSQNTVKTHLQNIFAKTGASRQPQLLRLVNELKPPIRVSAAPPDIVKTA